MIAIEEEARRALAAKSAAEHDLARLSFCPPWRHAAFAGVMAALIATPAFILPVRLAVLVLVAAAIVLIVQSDRRRLGVFINGYRRGKTRWVTFPMLGVILVLYALSVHFGMMRARPAISFALAAVGFAIGYAGSNLWQKVFVRELGA